MNPSPVPDSSAPFIGIFARDPQRLALIEQALGAAPGEPFQAWATLDGLISAVGQSRPRCVIADLNTPDESDASQCVELIGMAVCPVAVFVQTEDPVLMRNAIDAGAAAYVYDGLTTQRVRQVAEMAICRFDAISRLHDEVSRARRALQDRKHVDQAKQLLMQSRQLSEPQAYALLRKTAMDRNCTIGEVAESLVMSAGLLS